MENETPPPRDIVRTRPFDWPAFVRRMRKRHGQDAADALNDAFDDKDIVWQGTEPTIDGMPAEQWVDAMYGDDHNDEAIHGTYVGQDEPS